MSRLLVGLHQLGVGGSQLNALDLALAARDHGHDVAVFGVYQGAEPGPVAALARSAGLPVSLARCPRERPRRAAPYRPAVARALTAAARRHRADLVHVYEYPLILDAFHGPHRRLGVPLAATIYAMEVPRWLPRYPELVVGTQELVDLAAAFRARPTLIEPPVNTDTDRPGAVDAVAFRATYGIDAGDLAVVVVSRLEPDMKQEGIARAIAAVGKLADPRLRLVIVGDGPSRPVLERAAERANAALGRRAVILTGALVDPRPAYAAADIALGMGGSALRAMAFGRPLVVLGIGGFSRPCTPETLDYFLRAGFFGVGADGQGGVGPGAADGDCAVGDAGPGPGALAGQLRELADDPARRARLGAWSRRLVVDRFSLLTASRTLDGVYHRALAEPAPAGRRVREAGRAAAHRAAAELLPGSVKRRLRRRGPT